MNRFLAIPIAIAAAALPGIAVAQFSDSFNFLKAVKDRDGNKVTELLNRPGSGSVIINTRDGSNGESALHIVTARRDTQWLGFLLQRGGNPDVRDARGDTPLQIAVALRWPEGVQTLITRRANLEIANGSGETPLSKAVQNNDIATVRLLLAGGANPNRTDNAGFSPKDLARRDPRLASILKELLAAKPVVRRETQGPR